MKSGKNISLSTRERILEAAGEIFAEYGFRNATVRDICEKANVNIAAVNYHFGDKEKLYYLVLEYWREVAFQKYPLDLKMDENKSPEEYLKAFIRSFLFRILEEGQSSWFGRLVAREYMEPTKALDMLIEDTIQPAFLFLSSVVQQLRGKPASEETTRFCCLSIVSQCLFFVYAKHVIKKLFHQDNFKTEEIESIADHISGFSLEAIKSLGGYVQGEGK
ncbi:MAG: CerR family C-terminal domain-containing protein [Proteobacteria bacterium]|nr:CerR family C-terminal domain-containing protein [Pseudomonadota bacterium]